MINKIFIRVLLRECICRGNVRFFNIWINDLFNFSLLCCLWVFPSRLYGLSLGFPLNFYLTFGLFLYFFLLCWLSFDFLNCLI